jgi:hypothetical protein
LPITPFHFGPGAAIKAAAPGRVSFTVFALSQLLMDLEPVTLFFLTGDPAHPYLHTYLGAAAVAALAAGPGRRASEWAIRLWNSRLDEAQARWLAVEPRISRREALAGALLGAYSHVFVDSFMHADMAPLAPFAGGGGFAGLVSVEALQWLCVAAGAAGVAVLYVRRRFSQAQSQPTR